jgi:hypothetical protein
MATAPQLGRRGCRANRTIVSYHGAPMSATRPPGSSLGPTTRPGGHHHRRRSRRTGLVTVAVAACVVAGGAAAVVVLTSGSPVRSSAAGGTAAGRAASTTSTALATTTDPPTTTVPPTSTTDAGRLPQTGAFPTSTSPQFQAEMAALWQGVVSGSPVTARPAFLPESAYLQLKTIAGPGSDYTDRLLVNFSADVGAAHALLAQDAGTASLVSVNVPEQYGHWIPPRVCDNSVGYYEVANSRVVYQEGGQVRSFGIASLISWRGEWYVVHLGAILRSTSQGTVEDPEIGAGSSPDSTTC